MKPTSIKMFLVDGNPDGLKIIEKSNWSGRAVSCSRAQFGAVKKRAEFNRTGVYLLLGFNEEEQLPIAYIGEGDPVLHRLENHEKNKDFWDHLVVFTSKDENLNKAHIQFIESKLIELANAANRCQLENGNSPARPALSESDIADMETFVEEMRLIYSVLGIKIFDTPAVSEQKENDRLTIKASGSLLGYGYDRPEGFIVLAGTKCIIQESQSFKEYGRELRRSLLNRNIIKEVGDYFEFQQDYTFNSPSQAAYAILGRSANGRTEWRNDSGVLLKDLQEQILRVG